MSIPKSIGEIRDLFRNGASNDLRQFILKCPEFPARNQLAAFAMKNISVVRFLALETIGLSLSSGKNADIGANAALAAYDLAWEEFEKYGAKKIPPVTLSTIASIALTALNNAGRYSEALGYAGTFIPLYGDDPDNGAAIRVAKIKTLIGLLKFDEAEDLIIEEMMRGGITDQAANELKKLKTSIQKGRGKNFNVLRHAIEDEIHIQQMDVTLDRAVIDLPGYKEMAAPQPSPSPRYFATRIEGGPETSGKEPVLIVGKKYDCIFSVMAQIDTSVGISVEISPEVLVKMRERQVQVLVVGEGLEIQGGFFPLKIGQDYTSSEEAVNFKATKPGPCNLKLLLMLDGNTLRTIQYDFVAVAFLSIVTDAPPASQRCDWPTMDEIKKLRKQELTIAVSSRKDEDGLELRFVWGTDSRANILLKPDARILLEDKRRAFLSKYAASMQHTKGVNLSQHACAEFLEDLRLLGDEIYRTLFVLPAQQNLLQTGNDLRAILSKGSAPIQILPGQEHLPWMFLSDGKGALGLRHEVEFILSGWLCPDMDLTRKPLRMVCGLAPVFDSIKFEDGRSVLDAQKEALALLPSDRFQVRSAADEQQWLAELGNPAEVIYAYCHGSSSAGDPCLWMTQRAQAVSGSTIDSSTSIDWSGHPLVILAACTSGAIDPFRAVGLANSFMARGARGYIAVEGEIPAAFASLFMRDFFKEFFVKGKQPVGEVLFNLRSRFLNEMNNPWGILFTQFCRSEIAVLNG